MVRVSRVGAGDLWEVMRGRNMRDVRADERGGRRLDRQEWSGVLDMEAQTQDVVSHGRCCAWLRVEAEWGGHVCDVMKQCWFKQHRTGRKMLLVGIEPTTFGS